MPSLCNPVYKHQQKTGQMHRGPCPISAVPFNPNFNQKSIIHDDKHVTFGTGDLSNQHLRVLTSNRERSRKSYKPIFALSLVKQNFKKLELTSKTRSKGIIQCKCPNKEYINLHLLYPYYT